MTDCTATTQYNPSSSSRDSQTSTEAPDRSFLPWSAAECDLVAVGITVRDLAYAILVGCPLDRVKSPITDLRDECVKVIDEERMPGMIGVCGLLHNV